MHGEGGQVTSRTKNRKGREMRDAETVLGIIQQRGSHGLPLEDIYRQLYNPDLYLRAYARLYSNQGAMTRGTTSETVDGMSMKKIENIIDDLRHERYRWTAVRRVLIPKKNGKMRPLGIPIWASYCLSFQGVFGILSVVPLVDRSTICALLYHMLPLLTSTTTFPFNSSAAANAE
jgi:hypothetical protein